MMWQFFQTRETSSMPFWNLMNVDSDYDMESELQAFLTEFSVEVAMRNQPVASGASQHQAAAAE